MKARLLNTNTSIDLLETLYALQQPVLTFRTQSERTELSGPVLARWISKTMNLLTDQDIATITLDLPPHWQSLNWQLAASLTECKVLENEAGVTFVTANAEAAEAATWEYDSVFLVELAPLALAYHADLPAGVTDALIELAGYPDYPQQSYPRLPLPEVALPAGKRLLLAGGTPETVIPLSLACWQQQKHLVWVPEVVGDATTQAETIARLRNQELCDAQLLISTTNQPQVL